LIFVSSQLFVGDLRVVLCLRVRVSSWICFVAKMCVHDEYDDPRNNTNTKTRNNTIYN
jgi:hypothetical protein